MLLYRFALSLYRYVLSTVYGIYYNTAYGMRKEEYFW